MTFIQPVQKSFINIALFALIAVIVLLSFWLIFLYNRSVELNHSISQAQSDIRSLQASGAELQDKIFTLLGDQNLQKLSQSRSLVKDNKPVYVQAGTAGGAETVLAGR